jgi:hypothetical protein
MWQRIALCLSIGMSTTTALAAILLSEEGTTTEAPKTSTKISKVAKDGWEFRDQRKLGLGMGLGGTLGFAGLQMELNFAPETSFLGGFGIAPRYQSYVFEIKRAIPSKWFMPYAAAGFGQWYTTGKGGPIHSTTPGFLADRFLSDKQKASGQFSESFIFPSLGVQYLQLNGEWAGFSAYAEVSLLVDLNDLVTAPTGGLGIIFYL